MAGLNGLTDSFAFYENALRLRGQRQEILASNIANADTPNYKARDFDFNAAMQQVKSQTASGLAKTDASHIDGKGAVKFGGAPLLYRTTAQGNIDGNTVDMDAERNMFTDNALRYEAGITMITTHLRNLSAALQGN